MFQFQELSSHDMNDDEEEDQEGMSTFIHNEPTDILLLSSILSLLKTIYELFNIMLLKHRTKVPHMVFNTIDYIFEKKMEEFKKGIAHNTLHLHKRFLCHYKLSQTNDHDIDYKSDTV